MSLERTSPLGGHAGPPRRPRSVRDTKDKPQRPLSCAGCAGSARAARPNYTVLPNAEAAQGACAQRRPEGAHPMVRHFSAGYGSFLSRCDDFFVEGRARTSSSDDESRRACFLVDIRGGRSSSSEKRHLEMPRLDFDDLLVLVWRRRGSGDDELDDDGSRRFFSRLSLRRSLAASATSSWKS